MQFTASMFNLFNAQPANNHVPLLLNNDTAPRMFVPPCAENHCPHAKISKYVAGLRKHLYLDTAPEEDVDQLVSRLLECELARVLDIAAAHARSRNQTDIVVDDWVFAFQTLNRHVFFE